MKNDERERLEREILEIREREQCRIGQDLHDGVGQELTGIALLAKALAKQLNAESHPSAKAASDIASYTNDAIDSMRRLARGLYPIELSRHGLLPALEDLVSQTSQRFGVCCRLRPHGQAPVFEKTAEIHLYRIVQECIGNAIKHGQARHITIEFQTEDGVHTLAVTDDGVGFQPPKTNGGMGMHILAYRARAVGAVIEVTSPEDGGCRVTCTIAERGARIAHTLAEDVDSSVARIEAPNPPK